MNKRIISLIVGASIFVASNSALAETYPHHESINVLNNTLITIEDVVQMKVNNDYGIESLIKLGDFYIYNEKYKNTFSSFKYYNQAAIEGSEYAKMMVGYMTYKGYGVTSNIYQGISLLENIKKPYVKNANYLLGKIYLEDGKVEESIEIFKKIKDPQSYRYLTNELYSQKRYKEAMPFLNWLVEQENDTVSKRILGEIHLKTEFSNEKLAVTMLTEAAKEGDVVAMYNLGLYYQKGTDNTVANMQNAVKWYTIASQQNHAFSRQELLKIWNDNESQNNKYRINNDPYLTKIVQNEYADTNK